MTEKINRAARLTRLARIALAGVVAVAGVLVMAGAAPASGLAGQHRWRAQLPPVPAGAISSDLGAVSCASPRACVAVGTFETSGTAFLAFSETWNGRKWTIHATPDAKISSLNGVSCASPTVCIAVGDISEHDTLVALAERWNGTSWAVQRTSNPPGAVQSLLVRVSCPSKGACTAVGTYTGHAGIPRTLAEHWNGASWKLQITPNPSGQALIQFNGVSCASATACSAVGNFPSGAFSEAWNGKTWKIHAVPTPTGGRFGFLGGVSCTSANACTAAGDYARSSRIVPLAERWNGRSWEPQRAVIPAGATRSGLASVSCVRVGGCFAVGFSGNSASTAKALAEHWNGKNWVRQVTQMPAGGQADDLSSVSCPSPVACAAVGFFTNASQAEVVLAERYS